MKKLDSDHTIFQRRGLYTLHIRLYLKANSSSSFSYGFSKTLGQNRGKSTQVLKKMNLREISVGWSVGMWTSARKYTKLPKKTFQTSQPGTSCARENVCHMQLINGFRLAEDSMLVLICLHTLNALFEQLENSASKI